MLRYYLINGSFHRDKFNVIAVRDQIIEASSETSAIITLCDKLERKHYEAYGTQTTIVPIRDTIKVRSLGFDLLNHIRIFSDSITANQLEKYKSKFNHEHLLEIADLNGKVNSDVCYWALNEIQKRQKSFK